MIHYNLQCKDGHKFDSWFQSASAFDTLQAAGHVACAICGSASVEKALMTPRVRSSTSQDLPEGAQEQLAPVPKLTEPQNKAEEALAALKAHVEAHSDYVGTGFANEARAMHLGETPARPIWGEARGDEARTLIEDGVPVAPLPFVPSRKTN